MDLLPVAILVLSFKIKKDTGLKIILLVSLLSFLILLLSDQIPVQFQHYGYSLFILVEYVFFALFLWINIHNLQSRKIIVFLSVLFITFLAIYTILAKIKQIDSLSIGIESILILSFSFYFLYELINKPNVFFVYLDYRFWIILGIVIYLAGTFFIYIFANQLSIAEIKKFWYLTWVFYIIKAIFFSIGVFLYLRNPTEKPTQRSSTVPYLDMV